LLTRLAPFALLTFPGALAGRWLVERVSKELFDKVVIGLLIVGAVYLLLP
jgi:uncharacterized membrane protein YfcA